MPAGTGLPAEPTGTVNVDAATAPSPAAAPAADRAPVSSPPTTRQAAVATSSAGTESASTLAHVRASARKPATKTARSPAPVQKTTVGNPREVCAGRTEFSLYRCMKTQCAQPQFSQHPSCKRLKERDEVG